ncbi:ATP-dependent DNA helicase [Cellulosimicrobium funkei]|uniref:DNA 3'-5' helicase n=1 Tax=Cellulosimicrobium funkei TaxID=264251 RepID=A0A0H2L1V8_9MICO|nr:ATP-dependent DNA helicase [Cellulosimicrobium funkei]KLN34192.1 ATP-dependent DNA helicase [Cellulosimicrobium funkei]
MSQPASTPSLPVLEGEAARAVAHRGSHIQIIAAAGAGKTEVVSQRVASLLNDGEDPESIVAFTFTEKAAKELKERIRERVGADRVDVLGKLFVGTIHAYCFRLLQTYVPTCETYTPLDSNQLTNLLYREQNRLLLKRLHKDGKLFKAIALFQSNLDVVENELIAIDDLPDSDFKDSLRRYYSMLDHYRFMSFGTQIVRAVEELEKSDVHAKVTENLRHLIVDEYQDINPAQERLIELIAKPHGSANVVVVGDDDQAIYQWRGSNVRNIVKFTDRYGAHTAVEQFHLLTNRRSRPAIVQVANQFAHSIPERLDKQMGTFRPAEGPAVSIVIGHDDEEAEADAIAMDIEALHDQGVAYRDIAILVRGKVAYAKILDALEVSGIPVQPGGRTGLFEQPEAAVFGATYAWLADIDWAPGRFIQREKIELDALLDDYRTVFDLEANDVDVLRPFLSLWRGRSVQKNFDPSLVGDFYALTELLRIADWDLTDDRQRNRLGTIARFTNVLADYETVNRRSRRDAENPGEQVGGAIGDLWFYRNFALLLINYANGNYDDFDGEEDLLADGVALGTVHGSKGLEWPVVFLPSLTASRFPSSKVGSAGDWLVPTDMFDAARYEGSDADERRLFYVAITRARDWVALSSHAKVRKSKASPSPYLLEVAGYAADEDMDLPTSAHGKGIDIPDLAITYSQLAAYDSCPQSYLLRNELGFMPAIQSEIGYGNAVHHVMRILAEQTQATGKLPTPKQINDLLTGDFYLPFANKAGHKEMRERARKLVFKYMTDYKEDLLRTWATERPFELYLPGVVVSGRADVIYDEHDGVPTNLAIVDYKTAVGEIAPLQLQVYADAGRREGLSVGAAFIHDMGATTRHEVPVGDAAIAAAEEQVIVTAEALKAREFAPKPELTKCRRCDVRLICKAAVLN